MNFFESALTQQKARKMPKKSNNEKKKDAEAAGRPPKKTKQANKILISWINVFVIIKFLLFH